MKGSIDLFLRNLPISGMQSQTITPMDRPMTSQFEIRTMSKSELATAIEWAGNEGWNPGQEDLDPFFSADPEGYLMGFLDGEPVTCISAIRYGETFGFIGFYICKPEHRGKGYGWATWQAGMARLEGRTIGLDGVVDQPVATLGHSEALVQQHDAAHHGEQDRHPLDVLLGEGHHGDQDLRQDAAVAEPAEEADDRDREPDQQRLDERAPRELRPHPRVVALLHLLEELTNWPTYYPSSLTPNEIVHEMVAH